MEATWRPPTKYDVVTAMCDGCGSHKPVAEFYGHRTICRSCYSTINRLAHRRRREKIIKKYGGKCECCGEDRSEFLTVDHVNGGGNKEKRRLGVSRLIVRLANCPRLDGYRLLCQNCNSSLAFFGYCPHNPPENKLVYFDKKLPKNA